MAVAECGVVQAPTPLVGSRHALRFRLVCSMVLVNVCPPRDVLDAAAELLAPGGRLEHSTASEMCVGQGEGAVTNDK